MAVANIAQDRIEFFGSRFKNLIVLIGTNHRTIGRHNHGLKAIDFLKLISLGVGSARHASKLFIHSEKVLKRDRRQRLVFELNLDAFFCFDRLMQAIRPPTPHHHPTGKLINNNDFVTLHHVVLVTMKQSMTAQGRHQVMHQRNIAGFV